MIEDEGLLRETAGLVEWPVVLMGSFDESFLSVPPEVIATSIKTHQKCFALRDTKTGRLANRYLLVSNLVAKDGGKTDHRRQQQGDRRAPERCQVLLGPGPQGEARRLGGRSSMPSPSTPSSAARASA